MDWLQHISKMWNMPMNVLIGYVTLTGRQHSQLTTIPVKYSM